MRGWHQAWGGTHMRSWRMMSARASEASSECSSSNTGTCGPESPTHEELSKCNRTRAPRYRHFQFPD